MTYQLSTGKCIQITVEQYLDLTDDDIDFLNDPANNIGNYPGSYWKGSQIEKTVKNKTEIAIQKDVDYTEESDEFYENPLTLSEEFIEDEEEPFTMEGENENI